tara:strand:- start:1896 stop:2198 length:303 start_codon:yes stop_codon:yes gene_type:complete
LEAFAISSFFAKSNDNEKYILKKKRIIGLYSEWRLNHFVLFRDDMHSDISIVSIGVRRDQATPEERSEHSIAAIVSGSFIMKQRPDSKHSMKTAIFSIIM